MEKHNLLTFLILWATLFQGFAFSSDNRIADSSNHLVRKTRVIDRTRNANTRVELRDFPYVVNIKRNENHACAGSILAAKIVLTTAICVEENARYTVVSGTVSLANGAGTSHSVDGILRHPQYIPNLFAHDIALLSINPPITFGENINRPISIYRSSNGQLPAGIVVTVSGYGSTYQNHRRGGVGCFVPGRGQPRLTNSDELQAINLPTISLRDCRARNNHNPFIANEVICTYDPQKFCSRGEHGNPMVFNEHLVGILVSDGFFGKSDIFVSVALPEHRNWILSHMSPEKIPRYNPSLARPPTHHH